jgi:hypothetical protein
VVQATEHLLCKREALSSNPDPTKQASKKAGEGGIKERGGGGGRGRLFDHFMKDPELL